MAVNNSFEEIWGKLSRCRTVAMTLHAGPDGDSLGSCVGLKYVLERDFNCKVDLVSYDPLDSVLMSLPYAKEVKFGVDISDLVLKDYDATVFLDTSYQISGKLLKKYIPPTDAFIIYIDHHEKAGCVVAMNYLDSSAPSNCSILMALFDGMNVSFDKELSTRLMLGLCTDTAFLRHGGNRTLKDADFLKRHGADYDYISSLINDTVPQNIREYYSFLKDSLKKTSIHGKQVYYSLMDSQAVSRIGLNTAEIRLGPNYLSETPGYDVIFTLAETDGYIKGSFRSRGDVDVSKFAESFSGSGHKHAAGFKIYDSTMEKAESKVLTILKENL